MEIILKRPWKRKEKTKTSSKTRNKSSIFERNELGLSASAALGLISKSVVLATAEPGLAGKKLAAMLGFSLPLVAT